LASRVEKSNPYYPSGGRAFTLTAGWQTLVASRQRII